MGPSCLFSEFHGDNPETGAGAGRRPRWRGRGGEGTRGGDQGRGPWEGRPDALEGAVSALVPGGLAE